jgi:hypothetical protein
LFVLGSGEGEHGLKWPRRFLGDNLNKHTLSEHLKMAATHTLYHDADKKRCKGWSLFKRVAATLRTKHWLLTDLVLPAIRNRLPGSVHSCPDCSL